MQEGKGNEFITNPQDLQYIFDVVSSILEKRHELGSIYNFQSALKEASLHKGREVQMNLVYDQNRFVGFNFSLTNEPHKTTSTIPFKQQLILETPGCNLTVNQKTSSNIDVSTSKAKGELWRQLPGGELTVSGSLTAHNIRFIDGEHNEKFERKLESPSSQTKLPTNYELLNLGEKLASRQELDGLWLSGLGLKALSNAAKPLKQGENQNSDLQFAGNSVLKRLEQVLPQHFTAFKNGELPQSFNWQDPHSSRVYRFEFNADNTIKAFAQADTSQKTIFAASLTDAKRDRWTIEQCDFSSKQLQALSACYLPQRESIQHKKFDATHEL